MIITNLTRKLLLGTARTLARYANSIEKYLAEQNLPDGKLVSKISNDEPPAHWLAKVRQDAPHLLDNTYHESEFNSSFYRTNDHQGIQLNSSNHNKQKSVFSNNSVPQVSTRYTSKNLLETIKKYIYCPTRAIVRLSKSTENNEENLPDGKLVSKKSNDTPPTHWLAKVRQGAPYLLNDTYHESELDPSFYKTNDHQGIRLNSSNHNKQKSEFSNNSVPQASTRYTSKNLLETIKKYIYCPTRAIVRLSKSTENNEENLPDGKLVSKKLNDIPPTHWLAKVRQGAPYLLDDTYHESELDSSFYKANDHQSIQLNSSNHNKQESEFSNNSAPQASTRYTSKNLLKNNLEILNQKPSKRATRNFVNHIAPNPAISTPPETTLNQSKQKKASPPFQKTDEAVGVKKKSKSQNITDACPDRMVKKTEQITKIHLYPKSQTQASEANTTQYNHVKKPKLDKVRQGGSSEGKKPNISETLQQKIIVFPGNNRPKENVYKQPIKNNHRTATTTDPLISDLMSKNFSHQHKSDKSQSYSIQWPSLPDETVADTNQNLWPQLPEEEWFESIDSVDNSLKFWQLQEQEKCKLLSEREQRGKFWNE